VCRTPLVQRAFRPEHGAQNDASVQQPSREIQFALSQRQRADLVEIGFQTGNNQAGPCSAFARKFLYFLFGYLTVIGKSKLSVTGPLFDLESCTEFTSQEISRGAAEDRMRESHVLGEFHPISPADQLSE